MLQNRTTTAAPDPEVHTELPTTDRLFDILSNSRRRAVINTLERDSNGMSVSELVDHVAEQENDTSIDNISSAERNRVYTSLYQTHLPHLDEKNIINYNEDTSHVSPTPQTPFLKTYLEAADNPSTFTQSEPKWNSRLAAASAMCVALYTATILYADAFPGIVANVVSPLLIILVLSVLTFMLSENMPLFDNNTPWKH